MLIVTPASRRPALLSGRPALPPDPEWAPMSTACGSLDSLQLVLGAKSLAEYVAVLSWEVGVVERRSEEQGVEAGSSVTQLAVRQSAVPLLRQPHPPRPATKRCLFSGADRTVCDGLGYP